MSIRLANILPDLNFNPFLPEEGAGAGGEGGTAPVVPAVVPAVGAPAVVGPNGYPEKTPVDQMEPAHQAAYWRTFSRRNEDQLKAAKTELATLKPLADQYAALEQASKSEQEKAVEQAAKAAREAAIEETDASARTKYGSMLVTAEFKAHLAGKFAPEQIATLAGGLNVSAFLTETGEPDAAAIASYAAALAPAVTAPVVPVPRFGMGQGPRSPGSVSPEDAGRERYRATHPRRTT